MMQKILSAVILAIFGVVLAGVVIDYSTGDAVTNITGPVATILPIIGTIFLLMVVYAVATKFFGKGE